jgi:hypothetical protein
VELAYCTALHKARMRECTSGRATQDDAHCCWGYSSVDSLQRSMGWPSGCGLQLPTPPPPPTAPPATRMATHRSQRWAPAGWSCSCVPAAARVHDRIQHTLTEEAALKQLLLAACVTPHLVSTVDVGGGVLVVVPGKLAELMVAEDENNMMEAVLLLGDRWDLCWMCCCWWRVRMLRLQSVRWQ